MWSAREPELLWKPDYLSLVSWFKKVNASLRSIKSNSNTTQTISFAPEKRIKKRDMHILFRMLSHIINVSFSRSKEFKINVLKIIFLIFWLKEAFRRIVQKLCYLSFL